MIEDDRFLRLEAVARERRLSVAAVVRESIDVMLAADQARKERAAAALLGAEPMPVPETIDELRAELGERRP